MEQFSIICFTTHKITIVLQLYIDVLLVIDQIVLGLLRH